MAEFSWNPFGEEQDERTLGPRRLATDEQAELQLQQDLEQMFPEGWEERTAVVQDEEVGNG
jgi:hypothetical protein